MPTLQIKLKKTEAIGKDSRHYDINSIRELLRTDYRWMEKALLFLFSQQTRTEQQIEATTEANSRGFSACHARKLSYYAGWVRSGRKLTGPHLTKAHGFVSHYAQQVLDEIKRKAESANTNLA